MSDGKRINLQGFGTFKLSARAARKGRNPQSTLFWIGGYVLFISCSTNIHAYTITIHTILLAGEEIQIAASNSPSFTASKTFKEKCNPNR